MSLLEKIEGNAITDLSIAEPADDVFEDISKLLDALEKNNTIESVTLEGHFLGDLRNDSRSKVLAAIGGISSLKEVHLADSLLLVLDIAKMSSKATTLQVLKLKNLVMQGIEEDFDGLEKALMQHSALKGFVMEDCIPAIGDISMDKLNKCADQRTSIESPTQNQKTAKTA